MDTQIRKYRTFLTVCMTLLLVGAVAPHLGPYNPTAYRPVHPQPVQPQKASAYPQPATNSPAYILPPDKLVKAIALSRIRISLDIIGSLWGIAVLWLLLTSRIAAKLAAWTKRTSSRRWLQGLLFFAAFLLITTLAHLPLSAIGHQVSRNYGISVQGWSGWFIDLTKSVGLSLLIGVPILLLFHWIVENSPRRFWLWAWLTMLPLVVFSIFSAPLLDPVFNHFEPLAKNHAALVTKLETVVAHTGTQIASDRMFLMKASEKSTGLNAYVTGLGATKRYVMWDTATDRLPDDEILFIFGHESGHYVLNHIPKGLCGMAAGLFFVFLFSAALASWMARRFGSRWQVGGTTPFASHQGFVVLLFALSIVGFILQPIGNTFSRHFEHEADIYGQEAIHGLVADPQKTAIAAFNHLGEAWLDDPNPSPFIEFWEYDHPSVQTRANFAAHYNPWANGNHGQFFNK